MKLTTTSRALDIENSSPFVNILILISIAHKIGIDDFLYAPIDKSDLYHAVSSGSIYDVFVEILQWQERMAIL